MQSAVCNLQCVLLKICFLVEGATKVTGAVDVRDIRSEGGSHYSVLKLLAL